MSLAEIEITSTRADSRAPRFEPALDSALREGQPPQDGGSLTRCPSMKKVPNGNRDRRVVLEPLEARTDPRVGVCGGKPAARV